MCAEGEELVRLFVCVTTVTGSVGLRHVGGFVVRTQT